MSLLSAQNKSWFERRSAFGWAALATAVLLLIPLTAMQLTSQVQWTWSDFAVMGALAFGLLSLFIVSARLLPRKYRLLAALACAALFVLVWAELAVGVFTNLGS